MTRILVFAVLLAFVTWWLHRRLVRATGLGRPWSLVADASLVALWAAAVVGTGTGEVFDTGWARPAGFLGWVWLGALLYLILGLLVLSLWSLCGRLVARLRRGEKPVDESRRRTLRIASAVVVLAAVGTAGYGVAEAASPRIVRVRVPLRRLPAEFDGVRVALVTDLHVGPARGAGFTRNVVNAVTAEEPDLITLVGDLVDGTVARVSSDLDPLARLDAPLGVYGVSGNHEFYSDDAGRWLDVWERLGIRTLRNERVTLTRGGSSIDLAGVHDYSSPKPYEPDLPAALAGRDPSKLVVLLAHQPRQVLEASDLGVDLQLSGHTHGGQMWPLGYLVGLQQPSVTGLDRFRNTVLYTTFGVGAWGPPVRVGAPPEITILELVRDT
ncbi:MAG: metallophosphoesterase [Rhodococcus sp. (in: high G+C Gram-positive bacteria)]|uniref:metallophosphoesterase n=1 Tax=Rhodococcus sp. TaxID=1831 RepID=UPI003BAE5139